MGKLLVLLILIGGGAAYAMGVRVYPLHVVDYVPKPKPPERYIAELKDGTSIKGKLIYRDEELVILNDGTRDIDIRTGDINSVDLERLEETEVAKPKRKLYSYDPELNLFDKYLGGKSKDMPALKMPGTTLVDTYTSETQSKVGQGEHLKNRIKQLPG